jgi:hypothetical protein
MKKILNILTIFAILTIASACEGMNAAKRLRERTDIDLVDTNFLVTLVKRADLDRIGYGIALPKEGEKAFQSAVESAAGNWCWQFLVERGACHYNSKAGHDIFIERKGTRNYVIYTSG